MNKIIEVSNLKKNYGELTAVNDISFYVEQGKLFSFLGPNGAGKSTTIDTLCTLLSYDEGEIKIDSFDLKKESQKIKEIIGVVFQDNVLDRLLTVRENLTLRAALYQNDKAKIQKAVHEAATVTEVMDFIDRPYGKLSGGQRRRADIARALVNTPKILFLDEPTTGLDPKTRKNIWDTIKELQEKTGMTVFLTTHYMEEAAASDYIIVIDNGKIATKGTPAELKEKYAVDTIRISAGDEDAFSKLLEVSGTTYKREGAEFVITIQNTVAAIPILEQYKEYISSFEVLQGTMDDAFINITGKELRQ